MANSHNLQVMIPNDAHLQVMSTIQGLPEENRLVDASNALLDNDMDETAFPDNDEMENLYLLDLAPGVVTKITQQTPTDSRNLPKKAEGNLQQISPTGPPRTFLPNNENESRVTPYGPISARGDSRRNNDVKERVKSALAAQRSAFEEVAEEHTTAAREVCSQEVAEVQSNMLQHLTQQRLVQEEQKQQATHHLSQQQSLIQNVSETNLELQKKSENAKKIAEKRNIETNSKPKKSQIANID